MNKLKNAKEVFINELSPELRDSSAHKASTGFLSSTSKDKTDSTTKPQTNEEIIQQAKAEGKSVKETKELIKKQAQYKKTLNKIKEVLKSGDTYDNILDGLTRELIPLDFAPPKPRYEMMQDLFDNKPVTRELLRDINRVASAFEHIDEIAEFSAGKKYDSSNIKYLSEKQDIYHNIGVPKKERKYGDQTIEKHVDTRADVLELRSYTTEQYSDNFITGNGSLDPNQRSMSSERLQKTRKSWEYYYDINPIKEFGINYAEHYHNPHGAIQKLLIEKEGQVAGAFYKEGLGDIDLVWGDSKFGLAHILERRTEDFIKQGMSKEEAEAKALEFVKSIPDIIEHGEIEKANRRVFINTEQERAVLALDYNGKSRKWVLSAYPKD